MKPCKGDAVKFAHEVKILKFSSNANEAIRPVLNFFYDKILHAQKTQKNTRHQKAPKSTKSTKTQTSGQKLKMRLKTSKG